MEILVTSYRCKPYLLTVLIILSFLGITTTLSAQTDDYDYNPYEYAQEELFLTSPTVRERYESDNCAAARETINNFRNAAARGDEKEKYNYLRAISFYRCEESFHFLETQIKRSTSETDRCNAIMFLAWMLNPYYLPSILEYARKPALSIQEKAAIATAFMAFGVRDSYPDLKEQAISILDEICYDAPADVLASCILSYFNIGGDKAIKFFNSQLEQDEFKLYAALFLVQLGEHKQTFSIFAATLSSEDNYEIHTAIIGLTAIGSEEAIQLIRNLPPEKNKYKLKRSLLDFDIKEIMKGDKL